MRNKSDPFAIKEAGGDIHDRNLDGFSWRKFEGTTLGDAEIGTLRRVISPRVTRLMALLIGLVFLAIIIRLFNLQIINKDYWRNIAEGNRIRLEIIPAERGQILDRNGKVLASNTPSFRLIAIPADLPREETARQEILTKVLADVPTNLLDQENLTQLSQTSYLPQAIAYNLPHDLALKLMAITAHIPGFKVETVGERKYIDDESMGQLLGYVGKISPTDYKKTQGKYQLTDFVGQTGLELKYEDMLRGKPGKQEVEVDAKGKERKIYATLEPKPGKNITLTIDADLQSLAYKALSQTQKPGSVVVLEPNTGEILALASYPNFNPNLFTTTRDQKQIDALFQNKQQPLFFRAIAGEYPPGSTIKPFYAAAALNDGIITPQTTVLSTGGIRAGNQFFADWKKGGHGLVNVYSAIAESVNTFFYTIGGGTPEKRGLGIERITSFLKNLNFGQFLGIDLRGEKNGFVPTPEWKQKRLGERWYLGDTYNVSIGQGHLTVTPLQLAAAYTSIINNGELLWPHLVSYITGAEAEKLAIPPHDIKKIIISENNWQIVRDALRQTVTNGSARSLNNLPLAIAGKTGTAQTSPNQATHAWFAGYAPASKPKILVTVIVEHGGEGSSIAVPIAREVFNWYQTKQSSLK